MSLLTETREAKLQEGWKASSENMLNSTRWQIRGVCLDYAERICRWESLGRQKSVYTGELETGF